MLTTTPFFRPARGWLPHADDLEAAFGSDLGDDRRDLRSADVQADDQVLVIFLAMSLIRFMRAGLWRFR